MRIAVVHSRYKSAEPSGENVVVDDQVRALLDSGHDVRLLDRATDDLAKRRAYPAKAAITTLTGVGKSPPLAQGGWQPDVVHVHNTFPNWGTRWVEEWSDRLVLTLHNYRTICAAATLFRDGHECHDCLSTPVLPAVRHACYRGSRAQSLPLAVASAPRGSLRKLPLAARRVIALNASAQSTFASTFDRQIDLIPNFVTSAPAGSSSETRGWVYVGRLTPEKGVVDLLTAWPEGEPLDIYGAGPSETRVRRLADARPSDFTFHGLVERGVLRARLSAYTGLLLPSLWPEGLPTVALEAISAGTPLVISNRVAAARDLEQAGVASVYDPTAPDSLPPALDVVGTDRAGLGDRCRATFAERYSRDAWLNSIAALYEDVAG